MGEDSKGSFDKGGPEPENVGEKPLKKSPLRNLMRASRPGGGRALRNFKKKR